MKPGDHFLVFIPSALGYGADGAGSDIPPNSDLVFEIDLVSVK
jgi:FKBP-type peptidyl-prolyl cis-trans isomerase FkpA